MPLYTRADYEADVAASDAMSIQATRELLLGVIDGFTKLRVDFLVEEFQKKCKGKLFGTRLRMLDKEQAKKDIRFCYESNHKCGRSYCACACHRDKDKKQMLARITRV
jgi:hypothetical protein